MYDYSTLKGRIVEKGLRKQDAAQKIHVSPTTFGRKLEGKGLWDQKEISDLCKLLSIPTRDIPKYFFVEKT